MQNYNVHYGAQYLNSFGVPATCEKLIEIFDECSLPDLFQNGVFDTSVLISGAGYNTIPKYINSGLILKMANKNIDIISEADDSVLLRCDAGLAWDDLVSYSIQNGYCGLENLSLIPGSVGAAPIHNIGAYGYEVSDFLVDVSTFDLQKGCLNTYEEKQCDFGYRTSLFKRRPELLITAVTFKLQKKRQLISYFSKNTISQLVVLVKLSFSAVSIQFSPKVKLRFKFDNVRDILKLSIIPAAIKRRLVCYIRSKTLRYPQEIGNVGCFFKCPIVSLKEFEVLRSKYPNVEFFEHSENEFKISACWLIRMVGWAGVNYNGVLVDEKKPVVLLNSGNATHETVKKVSMSIVNDVRKMFELDIFLEAVIL